MSIGNCGPKLMVGKPTRSNDVAPSSTGSPAITSSPARARSSTIRPPWRSRISSVMPGTGVHVPMVWPSAKASAASVSRPSGRRARYVATRSTRVTRPPSGAPDTGAGTSPDDPALVPRDRGPAPPLARSSGDGSPDVIREAGGYECAGRGATCRGILRVGDDLEGRPSIGDEPGPQATDAAAAHRTDRARFDAVRRPYS